MAWKLKGTYVGNCACSLICACAVDGPPSGPDGQCYGLAVWNIAEGNLDDTDLSGLSYGLTYHLASNFGAGNVKMGVIIDSAASDDQEQALMTILSGQAGGPFADMSALIGEVEGPDRAKIDFTGGDSPRASVEGQGDLTFEPLVGPDGSTPTTVSNAMFGFAPTFRLGKASGQATAFGGQTFDAVYAEAADYEYTSETSPEEVRPRA
jgi:hypothetical protein